jgi:hypothetical protein
MATSPVSVTDHVTATSPHHAKSTASVQSSGSHGPAPASAGGRQWRNLPAENDTNWKDVLKQATDGSSNWSILAASIGTFVLTAAVLLYARPGFLNKKSVNGEAPRLSLVKLLAVCALLAALVAGLCFYLAYSRNKA